MYLCSSADPLTFFHPVCPPHSRQLSVCSTRLGLCFCFVHEIPHVSEITWYCFKSKTQILKAARRALRAFPAPVGSGLQCSAPDVGLASHPCRHRAAAQGLCMGVASCITFIQSGRRPADLGFTGDSGCPGLPGLPVSPHYLPSAPECPSRHSHSTGQSRLYGRARCQWRWRSDGREGLETTPYRESGTGDAIEHKGLARAGPRAHPGIGGNGNKRKRVKERRRGGRGSLYS